MAAAELVEIAQAALYVSERRCESAVPRSRFSSSGVLKCSQAQSLRQRRLRPGGREPRRTPPTADARRPGRGPAQFSSCASRSGETSAPGAGHSVFARSDKPLNPVPLNAAHGIVERWTSARSMAMGSTRSDARPATMALDPISARRPGPTTAGDDDPHLGRVSASSTPC
jgi:hypothetical protein